MLKNLVKFLVYACPTEDNTFFRKEKLPLLLDDISKISDLYETFIKNITFTQKIVTPAFARHYIQIKLSKDLLGCIFIRE